MRDTQRRQRGCLWLVRWLLPLGLAFMLPAAGLAQGQHEAAVEAMEPSATALPSLTNPLAPPSFCQAPAGADKQRLRAAAQVASRPTPPSPTPTPSGTPTAPTATQPPSPGAPPPPGGPSPGPGAGPAPNPLQPTPTTSDGKKPLPLDDPEQVRLHADAVRYVDGATEAQGHVEVRYQDITVQSFVGRLDKERVWGTFSGDVQMAGKLYSATAAELRLNLETEEFSARQSAAKVDPDYFQGQVLAPVYVRAEEVVGRPDRVVATTGVGTSCDIWPDPHWMLRSRRITVAPDNYVVFQRPALYLFGHLLVRYPWDLRLSLRRQDNRFMPEVGQNDVEGYYAKFAFGYSLNDENAGVLRLNLTQKRGIGVGVDHTLDMGKQHAEVSLFSEPSEGSFTGRLVYRGQYSDPLTSTMNMSFQQNSAYGSTSQSLSGDLTLRNDTRQAHTSLSVQHSELLYDVSASQRYSSTFSHRQQTGASGDWEIRASYQSSAYTTQEAANQELETQFTWRREFPTFSASLSSNQRFDVDGNAYTGDDTYYGLSRLPDLTLTTDGNRMKGLRLLGGNLNATAYLGYFDQQPDDLQTYRTGLEISLPGVTREFGKRASLRSAARFRQMLYEDAAQWIADAQMEYRLQLPSYWQTRLSFSYSHPEGYSPLRIDLASPACSLTFEAVRLVTDRMRVSITGGRDIENGYYHDAMLRGEFLFSPRDRVELQTGYSIQNSKFRPLNLRWIFATRRTWWSSLTVNYNLDESELTNVSLDADWSPSDKWRLQFLGGYTGSGGLDQADIRITRDLHCMLAQLYYSNTTGEIRLGLGIKAFPSSTRTFGVTGTGQYFESNFGDAY